MKKPDTNEIKNNDVEENKEEAPIKEEPLHTKIVEKFEYKDDALQDIENNRQEFLAFYKKQNVFKWVVGIICMAVIVFAWVGLPQFGKDSEGNSASWVMPLTIILVAFALAGTLAYSLILKRIVNRKMRDYFASYYIKMNEYVFGSKNYSEVNLMTPDKVDQALFDENGLYKDVINVGSRGLTEFKYNDKLMMVAELAAQIKNEKRMTPVFVGKYLVGPANYDGEMIAIYIKGDKRALPPTNLDGLKNVYDDEHFQIFTNNTKWKTVINNKVINKIKHIKTGRQLVDVAISVKNGKIFVCLGYDDPTMVLPLEHAFDPEPSGEFKGDLLQFCEIIEEFN